jgi:hypothetical protein
MDFGEILGEPSLPTQRLSRLRRINVRRQDALRHFVLQTRLAITDELLDASQVGKYEESNGAVDARRRAMETR